MTRNVWLVAPVAFAVLQTLVIAAGPDEAIRGRAMGTSYSVKLVDVPAGGRREAIAQAIQRELERLEEIFSLYRQQSELSRWNAAAADDWIAVSDDLYQVAEHALRLAEATDGALDPTVEPLMRLWRLREVVADWHPPSAAEVQAVLADVGWRHIELRADPAAIRKRKPRAGLDLNSVVEGYAIDRVAELLKAATVRGALVELGGEFRALGRRGDGTPWRIGIEDPRQPARLYAVVDLADGALATSGDYRQALVHQGKRYSHLIDPRIGAPIQHSGTAVSVLADDALTADGWATALMILGPEAGHVMAQRKGLAVSFVRREPADENPRLTSAAINRFLPFDAGAPKQP